MSVTRLISEFFPPADGNYNPSGYPSRMCQEIFSLW